MVVEIRKNSAESVLWPKFVRSRLWGLWAEITDEEQVGNLVHCCRLQEVGLRFISDTYSVALHFSGVFCFNDAAGKQSL